MDNLTEKNKLKAIDQLSNWSKWLISINFFASTGCVIILKGMDEKAIHKVGPYLFTAILLFALSVLCATIFTFCMVNESSLVSSTSKIRFLWLAKLQWALFALGLAFLLVWVGFLSKIF